MHFVGSYRKEVRTLDTFNNETWEPPPVGVMKLTLMSPYSKFGV